MQNNRKCSSRRAVLPQKNVRNTSSVPPFGGGVPFGSNVSQPMHGVQFQPSEICPRNYVIFDHTEDQSHVMYHPAFTPNLSNLPHQDFNQSPMGENGWNYGNNIDRDRRSSFSEDSDDINALLSLDGDDRDQESDDDDDDDDAVSTARTRGYDGGSSPDSCSNYAPKSRRVECSSSHQSPSLGGNRRNNEGKRKKLRKMVKVLQGMVPGGDQMNTAGVLDEAVKYLKSMKVEAKKLGPGDM